jgi:hypothetical protein
MLGEMGPVKPFRLMSSDSSAVSSNRLSGKDPKKVLLSISRDVKSLRPPNSSGTVPPSKVFESKSRDTRALNDANSLGSVPSKLFSSEQKWQGDRSLSF